MPKRASNGQESDNVTDKFNVIQVQLAEVQSKLGDLETLFEELIEKLNNLSLGGDRVPYYADED